MSGHIRQPGTQRTTRTVVPSSNVVDVEQAYTTAEQPSSAHHITDQLIISAAQLELQERLIDDRVEGIEGIARDVNDVRDVYNDMAYHVLAQGEQVRRIDDNIDRAGEVLTRGAAALQRTARESSSSRNPWWSRKCVYLIVLVVMNIAVTIMIVKKLGG